MPRGSPHQPDHPPPRRRRKRRAAGAILACSLATTCATATSGNFDFQQVVDRAEAMADRPYEPPARVPERFRELSFDQWRGIRYQRRHALWPDRRFRVHLNPAGYLFERPVAIHIVRDGKAQRLDFEPARFRHDPERTGGPLPSDLGYSGFRLLYPVNQSDRHDEVLSFQGASYFRALGAGQAYGLSARGLAIDTGRPEGEEFPLFRAFWLVRPPADAERMTVYALLDSASATGAYRIVLTPGEQTVTEVHAVLFPRREIVRLGLAPLTSMYLYGVGDHRPPDYAFPAVHDSEGLLIRDGAGEWIWRPLSNPERLRASALDVDELAGFGLMQRDRDPRHYDPGLGYARRPSAWVTPLSAWDEGCIELFELAAADENVDNIVAFWRPDDPPAPGESLRFGYRVHWQQNEPVRSPLGRVTATRIGEGTRDRARKYVIDFKGGPLADLAPDAEVQAELRAGTAEVLERRVEYDPHAEGWRLVLQIVPKDEATPPRLRARLRHGDEPVSETWDYRVSR